MPRPRPLIVRMEPPTWAFQLCVDDAAHDLGIRGRCTDPTFSRVVVARDTLAAMRVTSQGSAWSRCPTG